MCWGHLAGGARSCDPRRYPLHLAGLAADLRDMRRGLPVSECLRFSGPDFYEGAACARVGSDAERTTFLIVQLSSW